MAGVSIHLSPIHPPQIAHSPVSKTPVNSAKPQQFSNMLSSIASSKPTQRLTLNAAASPLASTSAPASTATPTTPAALPVATSSDGTSLANLMAAASYAGIPYADLGQTYNSASATDPNWQTNMANALEARLQTVASGSAPSSQVYDPNPGNDSVPISLTNAKQFSSSADQIQGMLNNMWSAVHSGNVAGYHNSLQQVDSWYQSNGQQNYYTGLSDAQVAAFNPSSSSPQVDMPNANATIAAAELAAITGQSASVSNLASVAQGAMAGPIKS